MLCTKFGDDYMKIWAKRRKKCLPQKSKMVEELYEYKWSLPISVKSVPFKEQFLPALGS